MLLPFFMSFMSFMLFLIPAVDLSLRADDASDGPHA
jgi:hypothetical protein